MVDHGQRDHATWSASATARNWHCAGALTLSMSVTSDKETIHSARGTAAHQVSEKCLRTGKDASDFLGEIEKTKEHSIEIDEELVNSAQMYVDYCRGRLKKYRDETGEDAVFWIEERFSLAALGTPFDAGGTGDFVIYFPKWKLLEIVDLKNGMGVVEVKGNPQGRSYGLGAVLEHGDIQVDSVQVTIVQPRAPHKDGRIRDETFHVADLVAWTADLLKAMARSKAAMVAHEAAVSNSVLMDEWVAEWLKPGKCTFCPVEGNCPANRASAIGKIDPNLASKWFEADAPVKRNVLPPEDPAQIAADLDAFDEIEAWIKARRAYAHAQAEAGVKLPTADGEEYHLVDKIGNRKWKADESTLAVSLLSPEIGLSEDEVYDRKIRSVAQLEKVLGAKRKGLIEDLWEKPITGTNLVRSDKTTRPATKSKVETYFESNKDN